MPQEDAYYQVLYLGLVINAATRAQLSGGKDKEAVNISLQFFYQLTESEKNALGLIPGDAGFYPALARLAHLKLQEARQGVETTEKAKVPDVRWLKEKQEEMRERWQHDREIRQKVKALSESRYEAARSRFSARIRQRLLQENPDLKDAPELLDRLSEQLGEAVETHSPSVSTQGRLSPEDRSEAVMGASAEISQYAQFAGIDPAQLNMGKIVEESKTDLNTIAADPQRFIAAKYRTVGEKPPPVPEEKLPSLKSFIVPAEVVQKVAPKKTEPAKPLGTAFAAAVNLTHPKTAVAQVKKTAVSFQTAPLIAFVNALSNVPEEAKTALILGLGLGPETPYALYVESPPDKPPATVFLDDKGQVIPPSRLPQSALNLPGQRFNLSPYIWKGPKTDNGIPLASPAIPAGIGGLYLAGARPEHFRLTVEALLKTGLPPDHPTIANLHLYGQQAEEYEKNHPLIAAGLRTFYEPMLQSGGRPFIPQLGIPLETGIKPIWETSKTAATVRNVFNQLGLRLGTHAEMTTASGTKVIQFVLFDRATSLLTGGRFTSWTAFRSAIYQKTLGAGLRFLAGTAIGKAAIELGKKAAIWAATKLGISLGLAAGGAAAGTALGGPIGTVIGLVVGFLIDIGLKILKKAWDIAKSLIITMVKEPEKAFAVVALGALGMLLLPAPFVILAFIPLIIGLMALVGALGSGVGAALGAIGGGVIGFFTLFLVSPFAAPIGLLVVAIIAGLAIGSFFIIMVTGAAFVTPLFPSLSQQAASRYPFNNPATIAAPAGANFQWPSKTTYQCSSNFGFRNVGTGCDYHEGIDIPSPYLSAVYPSGAGVIENIGYTDLYGNYIVVKHGENFYSLYGHLAEINVSVGQTVEANTVIGLTGNTGNVVSGGGGAGHHLHFGFSDCSVVPTCFNDGTHTPDPCVYFSCPTGCDFQDQQTGCSS